MARGDAMTKEEAITIIKLWPDHEPEEIGQKINASANTVRLWAKGMHEISEGKLCIPKPSKKRSKKDIMVEAVTEMLPETAEQ